MEKIVYNNTVKIRWDLLESWLAWLLEEQIPAVLATKLFHGHRLYRLLEQEEDEGPTFIVQYFTDSLENYQEFLRTFAPVLQQVAYEKWGDGFIAFRTIMSEVDDSIG